MSEPTKDNQDLPPLYSLASVGVATFLGSILAGGYMITSNYLALGERQAAKIVALGTTLIILIWLVISLQMAGASLTVLFAVNFGQVILALVITHHLQGKMLKSYEEMGGQYYSMLRAIGVAVLASVVFMFAGTVLIMLTGSNG